MGSKSADNVTQTNKVELSPEQKKLFNLTFPFVEQYAQNPAQPWTGETIAGFNPLETQGQQMALGAALGGGQSIADNATTANNFLLNPNILSPDSNPYLAASGKAVTDRLTQNLTENILPTIRSGSTVAGGLYSGGNTRQGVAEGLAIGKTQQSAGDALAGLYSDAYKAGLSSMNEGLRATPLTQAAQLFGGSVVGQVGAQQRAMEQAQLDAQIQQYQLQQSLPFLTAQDLTSLMMGLPGGQGVSTVTGATPKSSTGSSVLGGAATGASLGSMVPGIGTGLGAAGGALMALLMR